jgi:hypothetical protein
MLNSRILPNVSCVGIISVVVKLPFCENRIIPCFNQRDTDRLPEEKPWMKEKALPLIQALISLLLHYTVLSCVG